MRFLITLLLLSTIWMPSYSQTNFEWDIIIDSLEDSKDQLYSKTKMFIGETWKSAQKVIQNDDKDAGIVLVKGVSVQELYYQMNPHRWTFAYTVKLMMKDNKCRIIIDNVYCEDAVCSGNTWPLMPVAEKYPSSKGLRITGVNEDRYNTIMGRLKSELQSIVDYYSSYMREVIEVDSDW